MIQRAGSVGGDLGKCPTTLP